MRSQSSRRFARTSATSGPQKISVKFSATVSGSPKDPTLGVFLSKPITLTLDGPVDSKAKKADLTFELAAGPIKVDGGLRQVGSRLVRRGERQVVLGLPPARCRARPATSDRRRPRRASTRRRSSVRSATRRSSSRTRSSSAPRTSTASSRTTSQGDVDLAALVQGIAAVAKSSGSSASASPVSPAQIASSRPVAAAVREVRDRRPVGRSGRQADPPLRDDDRSARRIRSTKASSGIDGFKITLDVSATPTSSPSVSAPSSPAPISQLTQDLGGLLGGLAATGTNG